MNACNIKTSIKHFSFRTKVKNIFAFIRKINNCSYFKYKNIILGVFTSLNASLILNKITTYLYCFEITVIHE